MPNSLFRLAAQLSRNPYLLLALACLCWSGNHVMGRAASREVPPLALALARWLLPIIVLWPFAQPHLRRDWPALKAQWPIVLLLGITGGAIFGGLQFLGLQHTTALNVSVLNSLSPVLIIAVGALIFRDRLTATQIIGIFISLTGVLVIVTRLDWRALAALEFNAGDLIIVGNMFVWAIYCAFLRLRPNVHWTTFTMVIGIISTLGLLPFFIWEQLAGYTLKPTLFTLLVVGYVAMFSGFVAFVCWNRGVELIGSVRASPFLHLVALYSVVLAYEFPGETLTAYHVLGFSLILDGVFLTARRAY